MRTVRIVLWERHQEKFQCTFVRHWRTTILASLYPCIVSFQRINYLNFDFTDLSTWSDFVKSRFTRQSVPVPAACAMGSTSAWCAVDPWISPHCGHRWRAESMFALGIELCAELKAPASFHTSFRYDHHVVLRWLVECTMTWSDLAFNKVSFASFNVKQPVWFFILQGMTTFISFPLRIRALPPDFKKNRQQSLLPLPLCYY